MATLKGIVVYVCTIEVEVPDSKLRSSPQETLERIMNFATLKFDNLSKDITVKIDDVDATVYHRVLRDVEIVEKSDSNYENYVWDGERLVKE